VSAPCREDVLAGLATIVAARPQVMTELAYEAIRRAMTYLEAEKEAGVPEPTNLVTLRKEDCEPLLVPEDRVADFAEAGWHRETFQEQYDDVEEGDW